MRIPSAEEPERETPPDEMSGPSQLIVSVGRVDRVTLLFGSRHGLPVMLSLVPCFVYRAKLEENMLVARFGEQYRDYARDTWRFLPLIY